MHRMRKLFQLLYRRLFAVLKPVRYARKFLYKLMKFIPCALNGPGNDVRFYIYRCFHRVLKVINITSITPGLAFRFTWLIVP